MTYRNRRHNRHYGHPSRPENSYMPERDEYFENGRYPQRGYENARRFADEGNGYKYEGSYPWPSHGQRPSPRAGGHPEGGFYREPRRSHHSDYGHWESRPYPTKNSDGYFEGARHYNACPRYYVEPDYHVQQRPLKMNGPYEGTPRNPYYGNPRFEPQPDRREYGMDRPQHRNRFREW